MWTKGLLLAAPTLVSLFLLQSYFWVPSFEDQARGDPGRLTRYISVSIGDASILNQPWPPTRRRPRSTRWSSRA